MKTRSGNRGQVTRSNGSSNLPPVFITGPLFLILMVGGLILSGFKSESVEGWLGRIPVQSGGRVKPYESFAREALLSVTGKASLGGQSAVPVVWSWVASPEAWYTKSFLAVRHAGLRKEFSLMVINGKISPELVLTHPPSQGKAEEPLTLLEKKRLELYDQARLFQAVAQGTLPGFFPRPEDPRAGWIPLAGLADLETRAVLEEEYGPSQVAAVQAAFRNLVQALRQGEAPPAEDAARKFADALDTFRKSRDVWLDPTRINLELFYQKIQPFRWAWIFYLASFLLWFVWRGKLAPLTLGLFGLGFFFHTLGFGLRCIVAGRPPVSNMYESIIWVAWAVAVFSIVLGSVYRKSFLLAVSSGVAAFALLIGESFPAVLDPSLSPLVPVLRNNYWLTVHVLTITLSYGAFALAWGLAHASLLSFAFRPDRHEEHEVLATYVYRALQIGVVLLASGTILGGVWANDSWGRFWGWDPKETWALIALLGYLVVLHGRFARWLGDFGTALGSALAFLGVLMAWYGVNFVLAAGLHSYGFGGGGLPYVLAAVLADLVFISFLAFRYNKNRFRSALSK